MRIFLFTCLLFGFFSSTAETIKLQKIADKILDDLYKANGNYIFDKPKIKITYNNSDAALYLRRANTIELSQKVFEVCRSMNRDSLSALAFIIGHELSHAYQKDLKAKSTSFLAYDHHHNESIFFEESADVQGAFMAYLAGYKSTDILPELIERLYFSFSLPEKLNGYPSLIERQSTTKKVVAMVEELVNIFEAGNYLLSIGQYELAADCYNYVEDWYKGSEIYKNLGVSYAFLAMNFSEKNTEPYLFPLEINWTTRMKKPRTISGSKDLNPEEKRLKQMYLVKANNYLTIFEKMEPMKVSAQINKMCILILQKQYKEAINYYKINEVEKIALFSKKDETSIHQAKLVLGIAYAYDQNFEKANKLWTSIKKNGTDLSKTQATFNLSVMANKEVKPKMKVTRCPNILNQDENIDGVKIYRPDFIGDWIIINEGSKTSVSIKSKANSVLYTFKSKGGTFSLQRVFTSKLNSNKIPTGPTSLYTNIGFISTCQQEKLSFIVNDHGNLIEWAKYYSE